MSKQNELLTLHGQLLAGDLRVSSKIVELTIAPLVAIVTRQIDGLHDAQDVEQVCFDALFKYLASPTNYNPQRAELMTYLAAIAKGKAKTLRRSQKRRSHYENEYAAQEDPTNDPVAEVGDEASMITAIDWSRFGTALVKDSGDAEIVSLMKVGAHTPAAVAHALNLRGDAVGLAEAERRIERIRGRARRLLEKTEA